MASLGHNELKSELSNNLVIAVVYAMPHYIDLCCYEIPTHLLTHCRQVMLGSKAIIGSDNGLEIVWQRAIAIVRTNPELFLIGPRKQIYLKCESK